MHEKTVRKDDALVSDRMTILDFQDGDLREPCDFVFIAPLHRTAAR